MPQIHTKDKTYNTFALLYCTNCHQADEPPTKPITDIVDMSVPLKCSECGSELMLLECINRGEHLWDGPGHAHRNVATLHSLPDSNGRWGVIF